MTLLFYPTSRIYVTLIQAIGDNMKLADKHDPAQNKIPDNSFYEHFKDILIEAFAGLPEFELAFENNSTIDYDFKLTPAQVDFFEKFYAPSLIESQISHSKSSVYFSEDFLKTAVIGGDEWKCLDFLESQFEVLIVEAPIGWGKTTLLRYVYTYLVSQSDYLKKIIIPKYASIDIDVNSLNDKQNIVEVLYNEYITPFLKQVVTPLKITNSDFWDYLKRQKEFADLKQQEINLHEIWSGNQEKIKEGLLKHRSDVQKTKEYALHATKYMQEKYNKKIVIIIDDIDVFSHEVHNTIFREAIQLGRKYGIKVVMSMRSDTFNELGAYRGGDLGTQGVLCEEPVSLNCRDVREYLNRRIGMAFKEIEDVGELSFRIPGYSPKFTTKEAKTIFTSLLDLLISQKSCQDFIGNISNFNLRLISNLSQLYFASGFIERAKFYSDLVVLDQFSQDPLKKDSEDNKPPLWVLTSSLITGNYRTHFSKNGDRSFRNKRKYILNVYCNTKNNGPSWINSSFIRLHFLFYLQRKMYQQNGPISRSDLYSDYRKLFNKGAQTGLTKSMNRALYRMLQCGLVTSRDTFRNMTENDLSKISTISLTISGDYYINTLTTYYEYLFYMKDDVNFQDKPDFDSCIMEQGVVIGYKNVKQFLALLFEQEKDFIAKLTIPQRKLLIENFSNPNHDNHPMIVYAPVEAMINFGKTRGRDYQIYDDLQSKIQNIKTNLLTKINL
jgi:hypothetical protein